MCWKRLQAVLRKRWIKWQFSRLHARYIKRIRRIKLEGKAKVDLIWKQHQYTQITDCLVCIDSRLRFIKPLLAVDLMEKIHKYKRIYYRQRNYEKMIVLAEIVCYCDVENIEAEFTKLIQEGKKAWILWK
ncbi:MAG: hypothetical protein U7127_03580 [Phormidium sp.]